LPLSEGPRTHRLLLRDRHPGSPSRSDCAATPADGRPPHTHSLAPTQAHTNHPQEAHQLTLTPTPQQPVAAGEATRASRLAHNNSAKCRPSTAQPAARSTLDSRRATNQRLGVPSPRKRASPTSRTRGRPDRPASRNHITTHHHQPDNGHQPLPLDNRSSIWATFRSYGTRRASGEEQVYDHSGREPCSAANADLSYDGAECCSQRRVR
jgi:hypothetical protein